MFGYTLKCNCHMCNTAIEYELLTQRWAKHVWIVVLTI